MVPKKHILIVEDEEPLATGIKYNLEAEGYQVTWAGDGPSALQTLRDSSEQIDLMILDLMLPEMSGYAVCEELRANDQTLPVLILSARTLAEDRKRGFDVGANQYLTKPFDLEEFLSRVKNLLALHNRDVLGSRPPDHVTSFEFGNAKINFETYEVVVSGHAVHMTRLEMSLLRYFVEHEGRVISRRELTENVWGLRGNINTRAPDQFIRRLRKTFEPVPAKPRYFLTVRDAGYRFVASTPGS